LTELLKGIRVLDFTRVIAGSTGTMYLADLGAEVIKVEPPEGEVMRYITPIKNGESGFFISLNRGKKGITLDLKREEAVDLIKKLVPKCDVVIENFKPGTMKSLGLSYDDLKVHNPNIIYASVSGYGQTGPWADLPAYDLCVQAMCGLMTMNGFEGIPPLRIGMSVTDYFGGLLAVVGILSALRYRDQGGGGQYIDVSMFDGGVSLLENAISRYSMHNDIYEAVGSRHPAASPHNVYKTKDGYIAIIQIEDRGWQRLTRAIGKPELGEDPKFAKALDRLKNVDEVDRLMEEWTSARSTEEVVEVFTENNLAYGVCNNAKDIMENEHVKAREMILEVEHPNVGKVHIPGIPIKFSKTKAEIGGGAPTLGQFNKEVFCDIAGLSEEEFNKLVEDKVI